MFVRTLRRDDIAQDRFILFLISFILPFLIALVALLASYLPAFDSSADIILTDKNSSLLKRWIATSLRWDAFHFLHIAQESYTFEYEWAFLSGVPIVLRSIGRITDFWTGNTSDPLASAYNMLLGHFLITNIVNCETTRTLYLLTMEHTGNPSISLLTGYMFLLSSSPAAMHLAPYAEPWFTFLSYKGMIYCAQKRWVFASMAFALASTFRSNGIFLTGFIVWGMIVEPVVIHRQIKSHNILLCIILSTVVVLPFALHQLYGYLTFCGQSTYPMPSWCTDRLPLIYNHVQSRYWNVGFLRYWTLQQLPNFVISAPVLLLLSFSSITYILRVIPGFLSPRFEMKPISTHGLLVPSLLPHAIHALIFMCILLFASHTQIILRLAPSMPFTYWSATRLFFEHPKWAKAWVAWSIVWGAVSIVLWTTFLPPA